MDDAVERMQRFLQEMVDFVDQTDIRYAVPVIELQLGAVLTVTSLLLKSPGPSLSITAFLPRQGATPYRDVLHAMSVGGYQGIVGGGEFFWHAEQGCFVVVRLVPVLDFQDERSVLDAILDLADDAFNWFCGIFGTAAELS